MKITKQTDTELTLENDIRLFKMMPWLALGLFLVFLFGFVFFRSVDVPPGFAETMVIMLAAFMIACGVTAVLLGLFVLLDSFSQPIRAVTFDKNANQIHFEKRVVWRNWQAQSEKIPLDLITAVHLKRVGRDYLHLDLAKTRWETIKIDQETVGSGSLSTVAETISDFLNIPLLVFVDAFNPIMRQPGTPRKEKDAFYDI